MQYIFVHQGGAQAAQFAFGQLGKTLEQQVGDGTIEHAVAEKFQSFVVTRVVTTVRQRLFEQAGTRKSMTKLLLKYRVTGHQRE